MAGTETIGILLVNTGSPAAPETAATRAFLRQFLSDPRVIDISPLGRWALLNLIILPFRPKRSARAYRQVWTEQGSPLIVNSAACRDALREALPGYAIEMAMACGEPSIGETLEALCVRGVERIVVAPMFPHYASATVGSVLEAVYKAAATRTNVPALSAVPPFYNDGAFLDAWCEVAQPQLDAFRPDHLLISYHGLPERQIRKSDPAGDHCLQSHDCCDRYLDHHPSCYRAHCLATTRGIAERLGLAPDSYTVTFQSRLGRDRWLGPATDSEVVRLAKAGVKRLAVISPTFVADCLETLEELGLRAKASFIEEGGDDFCLVTSLNSHPAWIRALAGLVQRV